MFLNKYLKINAEMGEEKGVTTEKMVEINFKHLLN